MNKITVGFLFVLVVGIAASPSLLLQPGYGITSGASENRNEQENIFVYYFGILEFTENIEDNDDNSFISCSNVDPSLKTDTIETNKDPLLNIDDIEDEFFIILSQAGSDSHEYLQIALPQKNGSPSYLVDVKKEPNQLVTGGLYQADYLHLAFVFESDGKISVIDDENHYKKYFAGDSKSIVTPSERLDPGTYDFHAVLFQSDRSNGLSGERCAISLNWKFAVDSNGEITTKPPQTKIGMISNATEKFPPLKQYKMGMESSQVECKKGHRLVEQEGYSNDKRIACVTPETKIKLIERGWTTNNNNGKDEIKNTEPQPQETSPLPIYPSFENGVTQIINPDYESLEYRSTSPVIDDMYLLKNVQQWKDAWPHELEAEYEKYRDEFYIELGRLLMKNEMQQQMNSLGIVNTEDDFEVVSGTMLTSLPPHIGFSSIIHATDGHYYLLQGMAHANQVNYYRTAQLQYPNPIEISLGSGEITPDVIPQISILTRIGEDGNMDLKSVVPPVTVLSHPGDVEFYNDTPEILTIYINKEGLEEFSFETSQKIAIQSKSDDTWTFTEPGSYSWSGRIPIVIEDKEYELNTGGEILVLSDDMNDLSKKEKMETARTMLLASSLPISGIGQQGKEDTIFISLSPAINELLPESKPYYLEAAQNLIPFEDISIILE